MRPKDWEKARDEWLNRVGGEYADSGKVMEASIIYEAGAEAMLEALEKTGSYFPCDSNGATVHLPPFRITQSSTVVIIPQDSQKLLDNTFEDHTIDDAIEDWKRDNYDNR